MIFSGVTATTTSSEDRHLGGIRVVTFMIYLSSVEAGGYTVFPQAGVSVKPELGSALYWFNYGAQNNYDSRTYHLGKNKDTNGKIRKIEFFLLVSLGNNAPTHLHFQS